MKTKSEDAKVADELVNLLAIRHFGHLLEIRFNEIAIFWVLAKLKRKTWIFHWGAALMFFSWLFMNFTEDNFPFLYLQELFKASNFRTSAIFS